MFWGHFGGSWERFAPPLGRVLGLIWASLGHSCAALRPVVRFSTVLGDLLGRFSGQGAPSQGSLLGSGPLVLIPTPQTGCAWGNNRRKIRSKMKRHQNTSRFYEKAQRLDKKPRKTKLRKSTLRVKTVIKYVGNLPPGPETS